MSKQIIIQGDSRYRLAEMEDNSVDAVITDPPYGLNFMGKKWDYDVPSVELWKEVLRVLKPGAFLLSFAGSRTYHRMAVNIEDAGFEIRDQIMWIYGSGFPKSHNIGKAVDKLQGNNREVIGEKIRGDVQKAKENGNTFAVADANKNNKDIFGYGKEILTKGNSEWEGWGTALKPAHEPIVVARKPLSERTVAMNVLKYGTGGINIDACRVGDEERTYGIKGGENLNKLSRLDGNDKEESKGCGAYGQGAKQITIGEKTVSGRFPANIILDEEAGKILDEQTGILKSGDSKGFKGEYKADIYGKYKNNTINPNTIYADKGGASRFFYCAKASKKERNFGLEKNNHPTVKPIAIMKYLIKLVTPEGAKVCDPFGGSGTTMLACKELNRDGIMIEREGEYCNIAQARLDAVSLEGGKN